MSFFNKFFNKLIKPSEKEEEKEGFDGEDLSVDEQFVKKFIHKGGKFLYCSDQEELERSLTQILQENQWNNVIAYDDALHELLTKVNSARTIVRAMFPVTLAPKGKNGIRPIRLFKSMKKKIVSK